jgi:hypothetical protein
LLPGVCYLGFVTWGLLPGVYYLGCISWGLNGFAVTAGHRKRRRRVPER